RIIAGAARQAALFPQFFPIPHSRRHLSWQRESELMREHTHLPAMVGFVRKHVAQHFRASRPRPGPAVSQTRSHEFSLTASSNASRKNGMTGRSSAAVRTRTTCETRVPLGLLFP